nr:cyclic nucleotide-binding domain-containing protein [Sulfurimonas sp. SAG-AH-194-C21]
MIVFLALIVSLFTLQHATSLVWTVVIPILPVLFLIIGYSNWRKICPLALVSKLSQNINLTHKRKVPEWFENNFYFLQFFILLVAFSSRLVFLNFNSFALAIFFVCVSILAFGINLFFTGKSWCNFFCPVGVVEKIYCISNSHQHNLDSACTTCSACKKNCPDIDMESNYWKEATNNQKTFVFYSFSGLILGFYLYFYLQSGSFSHYFTGNWTEVYLSPFSSGFFFAPIIPLIIAAPFTLIVFSILSYFLFKYIERYLWSTGLRKSLPYSTFLHRIKVTASFIAFNIFYIFAGAPTYQHYPLVYGIFHFVVIVLSAITLHKEFFREENFFIQERFALKMIKRWKSDDSLPTNLKEIYYTYINKKKNKEEQLQMYKDSLSDLMQEGILTEDSMVILEKLREQMGISQKEHLDTIRAIKLNHKDLFDNSIEKSAERRYQKNSYKKMLEDILDHPVQVDFALLSSLQEQFHINDTDHKEIMQEIMNANTHHEEDIIKIIKEMQNLAVIHVSYFDDNSLETNLLKFALRQHFNELAQDVFIILNIIYEAHKVELQPLRETFKYDRGELLLKCQNNMKHFMDEGIVNAIMCLMNEIEKHHQPVCLDDNVIFLKELITNNYIDLSCISLLCLHKYDISLYSDICYDKFLDSEDIHVSDIAKKVSTLNKKITLYDKMMYLHSIDFFTNIPILELKELAHNTHLEIFKKHQKIIQQGDNGDSLYMLVDGEVEVIVNQKTVTTLSKGSYFGEISVIAGVKRTASIMTVSDCTTLQLKSKDFKNFIMENPDTSIELMREITLRLIDNKN